jgi:hypothetical protein
LAAIRISHAPNGAPRHSYCGQVGERLVKDVGRHVFRDVAIAYPPHDEGVDRDWKWRS